MTEFFGTDAYIQELSHRAQALCGEAFARIEATEQYNAQKVLRAFMDARVSEADMQGTTGYGYNDRGRDKLDEVFARMTGAPDALVRHNFVSGTHAISTALFGVLRPGDTVVSLTGAPYDTIHATLGLHGEQNGSLRDFGITYRQLDLLPDGTPDYDGVADACKGARMAYIQRSRGYTLRPSLTAQETQRLAALAHAVSPDIIVFADNCYCEFVEKTEPSQHGIDLFAGSLIKNPGAGIARTGGYIAGKSELVEQCAYRLTSPGIGREVGCTLGENGRMLMGLYLAPSVVAAALKTACFAAALFELAGFEAQPAYHAPRADIVQSLLLRAPEPLIAFCQAIQAHSAVDSYVSPVPSPMPGYDSEVIMASGSFTAGSSIELSADAPLREPYAVWLQGGLTFASGRIGITQAAQALLEQGYLIKQQGGAYDGTKKQV